MEKLPWFECRVCEPCNQENEDGQASVGEEHPIGEPSTTDTILWLTSFPIGLILGTEKPFNVNMQDE